MLDPAGFCKFRANHGVLTSSDEAVKGYDAMCVFRRLDPDFVKLAAPVADRAG
jgi:hypothetical protein